MVRFEKNLSAASSTSRRTQKSTGAPGVVVIVYNGSKADEAIVENLTGSGAEAFTRLRLKYFQWAIVS